jgi:competence protein ComGC
MKSLKQAGFTLIEFVLIGSAIAALLVVALPAIQ